MKDKLLALFYAYTSETGLQSGLRDLMTDLRHIADELDLDFDLAGVNSEEVWQEERAE